MASRRSPTVSRRSPSVRSMASEAPSQAASRVTSKNNVKETKKTPPKSPKESGKTEDKKAKKHIMRRGRSDGKAPDKRQSRDKRHATIGAVAKRSNTERVEKQIDIVRRVTEPVSLTSFNTAALLMPLCNRWAQKKGDHPADFCFSPLLLSLCLCAVREGADEATKKLMQEKIFYSGKKDMPQWPDLFAEVVEACYSSSTCSTVLSTIAYHQMYFPFDLAFLTTLQRKLDCKTVRTVDFKYNRTSSSQVMALDLETATKLLRVDVKKAWKLTEETPRSNGAIEQLQSDCDSKIVLMPHLIIKATWSRRVAFKGPSGKTAFKTRDGKPIGDVPMFKARSTNLECTTDPMSDYIAFGLPCRHNHMTLYIILPNQDTNFSFMSEDKKDSQTLVTELKKIIENCKPKSAEVEMPRIALTQNVMDLKGPLLDIGLGRIFEPGQVDLRMMIARRLRESKQPNVSKMRVAGITQHVASLYIGHEGIHLALNQAANVQIFTEEKDYEEIKNMSKDETKADGVIMSKGVREDPPTPSVTASTSIVSNPTFSSSGSQVTYERILVNRPFLYVLYHNATRSLLLIGRCLRGGYQPPKSTAKNSPDGSTISGVQAE